MNNFIKQIIEEKFASKKQQRYFYAKANDKTLSKKERKKWQDMAGEFSDKTNFKKLPDEVEKEEQDMEEIVDDHGNIRLPILGELNVLGYTIEDVRIKIEKLLNEKYFKTTGFTLGDNCYFIPDHFIDLMEYLSVFSKIQRRRACKNGKFFSSTIRAWKNH